MNEIYHFFVAQYDQFYHQCKSNHNYMIIEHDL